MRLIFALLLLAGEIILADKAVAQPTVVRYLDRCCLKPHKKYKEGYIPVFLQYYSGQWHGLAYYEDNSTKMLLANFTDSNATTMDGICTLYDRKGQKIAAGTFVQGKEEGMCYTYGPEGNVITKASYKEGLRQGPFIVYYPDGSVNEEGHFKHGQPDSLYKIYHRDGRVAAEQTYSKGSLEKEVCYDEAGYKRNCSLFRSREATLPVNFTHFYKQYFTFSKEDYKMEDSVLNLDLLIDLDGKYYFYSLYKRKDGATGKLARNRLFWELLTGEEAELEAVGSLRLREEIKERIQKLPKAMPAYENNIVVQSIRTFEVWFKE